MAVWEVCLGCPKVKAARTENVEVSIWSSDTALTANSAVKAFCPLTGPLLLYRARMDSWIVMAVRIHGASEDVYI